MNNLKITVLTQFISGSERTIIIKKNIIGSFAIKGLSILTSLILIPFTIHLIDKEKYGIWITIYSIVTWFNMMDIGIGNGFRNKYTDAIARNERILAKEYVQTFYASMSIIALFFFIVLSSIVPFLNWHSILNLPNTFNENINLIIWLIFVLFCIQLYIKNISTILLALQKTTYSNSLMLFSNIIILLFVFIIQELNMASLFSISMAFMMAPILVFFFTSILAFNGPLKEFKPKIFVFPRKAHMNDLISLGFKFFLIQIATIVLFSSNNIIITQLYGPAEVTPYNVGFRLFSSAQIFFTIIITPFWAAFTDANAKGDFVWIKKSIGKLITIWGLFSIGIILLWIISPYIIRIWIGTKVFISYSLSLQLALFAIITTWTNLFVYFINGIGKIKVQLFIALFQCILNIPLAIFFAKGLGMNIVGIILATNLNMLVPAILIPIQYKKIMSKTAKGFWNK